MDWTDVTVTVPRDQAELAAAIASMVVTGGVYVEDYGDLEEMVQEIAHIDLIDEDLLKKDRENAVVHVYISPEENPAEALGFLRERFSEANIPFSLGDQSVREEDWATNWKQYFHPQPVGEKLLICPSWEEPGDVGDRAVLTLDPGMAFGTGEHATTRLMLEAMEDYITPDTHVLDVGCGSGILSMAALLLGAHNAVGVDIDPVAVKTAIENGERVGMTAPRYEMRLGNLAEAVEGEVQVVVANIVADAICALSPDVPRFLAKDGVYLVSGIIDTREQDVLSALAACGFQVVDRKESGGWLCLVTKKAV